MKNWLRLLFLPMVLLLLAGGVCVGSAAAGETMEILKVRHINGDGKVFLPQIHGMAEGQKQELLNSKIKDAIFSLNNTGPGSSLNGEFTVSFYNQNVLGIHFTGYSFTKDTAHPNKIDQGIHIDLATGRIFTLADLFVAGVDFESRIKALCKRNDERYRLQIQGLWDGWKKEEFLRSWTGADAAFLLSDKAVRVYSIPRYATGAISGYSIPYADLMDLVDAKGSLWRKLQDKSISDIAVSPDNEFDKTRVKVGDVCAGLTVASVDRQNGSLRDVLFTGEKELVGTSEWVDSMGDGPGYVFTVDGFYADSLPMLKGFRARNSFVLTMDKNSPSLPKDKVHVKIIVDDFSIGERQIMTKARLVSVVP